MRYYVDLQIAGEAMEANVQMSGLRVPALEAAIRQQLQEWGYEESDIENISITESPPEIDFDFVDTPASRAALELLQSGGWMDQKEEA